MMEVFDWNRVIQRFTDAFELTFATSKKVCSRFHHHQHTALIQYNILQCRRTLIVSRHIYALSMALVLGGQT